MTEEHVPLESGAIISHDRKPSKNVWEEVVFNEKMGKEEYEDSLARPIATSLVFGTF